MKNFVLRSRLTDLALALVSRGHHFKSPSVIRYYVVYKIVKLLNQGFRGLQWIRE